MTPSASVLVPEAMEKSAVSGKRRRSRLQRTGDKAGSKARGGRASTALIEKGYTKDLVSPAFMPGNAYKAGVLGEISGSTPHSQNLESPVEAPVAHASPTKPSMQSPHRGGSPSKAARIDAIVDSIASK